MKSWFGPRTLMWLLCVALAGAVVLVYFMLRPDAVLYCAQDQEFATDILERFRQLTGLKVATKFDTEATKSVSLYTELVNERDRPRCDVFWNNEILSMIRLQRKGMLEPYDSPSARPLEPFPASARTDDHTWHAFGARARVLLVNTKLVKEEDRPKSLLDLTHERFKGQVVMAKPQFGTSATQAACLFQVMGEEKAKAYYRDLRKNGVQIAPGNKQAAEWVGEGKAAVGVTDTDDALDEIKPGADVVLIYPDREKDQMGTLYIPNTVGILRGCPHPAAARRLVDYLLSAEVEGRLAESDAHQIPFNPEVRDRLKGKVEAPPAVKAMEVDFARAADLWDEVQTFLRDEFAR
jgi:iron(III) transport system substrate-binding protein